MDVSTAKAIRRFISANDAPTFICAVKHHAANELLLGLAGHHFGVPGPELQSVAPYAHKVRGHSRKAPATLSPYD